jgi:hypothetical protein
MKLLMKLMLFTQSIQIPRLRYLFGHVELDSG